jgi:hypothetical protein
MPYWYSPFHNVLPAALLTFQYGYLAFLLFRLIGNTNKRVETHAE